MAVFIQTSSIPMVKSFRLLFFLSILMLPSFSGEAQTSPMIGAQFGGNLAELHGAGTPRYTQNKTGISAGAFVNLPLNEAFSVETKFLYSSQGAKFKEGPNDYKLQLRYMQIPVMGQIGFGKENLRIFANAGPYFGLLMEGNRKGKINQGTNPFTGEVEVAEVDENVESFLKSWDFGMMGSIGTHFPFYNGRMSISISYSESLPEIQSEDEGRLIKDQRKGPIQNSAVIFSIGYGITLDD